MGFRVPRLIACLAAGVVSGCGWGDLPGDNGPTSQREQIVALVERSFEAIANQDAATACQLIAPSQLGSVERCERVYEREFASGEPPERDIKRISIHDGFARVTWKQGGFMEATKEDGRWYVSPVD